MFASYPDLARPTALAFLIGLATSCASQPTDQPAPYWPVYPSFVFRLDVGDEYIIAVFRAGADEGELVDPSGGLIVTAVEAPGCAPTQVFHDVISSELFSYGDGPVSIPLRVGEPTVLDPGVRIEFSGEHTTRKYGWRGGRFTLQPQTRPDRWVIDVQVDELCTGPSNFAFEFDDCAPQGVPIQITVDARGGDIALPASKLESSFEIVPSTQTTFERVSDPPCVIEPT